MSYTPTEWKTGDVITAEKLNNMESGIVGAGSIFVLNTIKVDENFVRLSMKMGDIVELLQNGKVPYLVNSASTDGNSNYAFGYCDLIHVESEGNCSINFVIGGEHIGFTADSYNEYPIMSISG